MAEALRITATEARSKVTQGKALLVCAYANEAAFARYHLDGAMSLADFQARAGNLPKGQEIIFYCD